MPTIRNYKYPAFLAAVTLVLWFNRSVDSWQRNNAIVAPRYPVRNVSATVPPRPVEIVTLPEPATRPSPDNAPADPSANNFTTEIDRVLDCVPLASEADRERLRHHRPTAAVPRPITSPAARAANQWYLLAEPEVPVSLPGRPTADMRLTIVNPTAQPISFEVSSERLGIVLLCQNPAGKWIRVRREVIGGMEMGCGTGDYEEQVNLPAGHAWSFAVPRFAGPFKTRMRFMLVSNYTISFSNEFDGYLNPIQIEPIIIKPEEQRRRPFDEPAFTGSFVLTPNADPESAIMPAPPSAFDPLREGLMIRAARKD